MNISLFKKFTCYKNYYQFLYLIFIINIIMIVSLLLLTIKMKTTLKYSGIINDNNILVISNLSYEDANTIIKSKYIKIDKDNVKFKVLESKNLKNFYTIKLELDKYYLDTKKVIAEVLIREENLYEFVLKTMKGE